jgi:hypothetical protein
MPLGKSAVKEDFAGTELCCHCPRPLNDGLSCALKTFLALLNAISVI